MLSANVVLFHDWDKLNKVKEDNVDWSKPFNELKLTEHRGIERFLSYHVSPWAMY